MYKYGIKSINTIDVSFDTNYKNIKLTNDLCKCDPVYGKEKYLYDSNWNIICKENDIITIENNIIKKNEYMVVVPTGGLCNYLRFVFSYHMYCKNNNKKLIVIWNVTDSCTFFFLDYFEPVENIEFLKNNDLNYNIDAWGCHWHNDYSPFNYYLYDNLKLNSKTQKIINDVISQLGNYISVHIRRTDHIASAKSNNCYTDDEEFINFINQYDKYNLYIATDNRETQDKFLNLYGDKIKNINLIDPKNCSLRKTNGLQTIIDLYVCINSAYFKGSGWSSFTDFILHNKIK